MVVVVVKVTLRNKGNQENPREDKYLQNVCQAWRTNRRLVGESEVSEVSQ